MGFDTKARLEPGPGPALPADLGCLSKAGERLPWQPSAQTNSILSAPDALSRCPQSAGLATVHGRILHTDSSPSGLAAAAGTRGLFSRSDGFGTRHTGAISGLSPLSRALFCVGLEGGSLPAGVPLLCGRALVRHSLVYSKCHPRHMPAMWKTDVGRAGEQMNVDEALPLRARLQGHRAQWSGASVPGAPIRGRAFQSAEKTPGTQNSSPSPVSPHTSSVHRFLWQRPGVPANFLP